MGNMIEDLSPAAFVRQAEELGVKLRAVDGEFAGFGGNVTAAVFDLMPRYEDMILANPGFLPTVADLINGAARH